jgi:monofunctional biosynthetic peptidoglycan transglycosylase
MAIKRKSKKKKKSKKIRPLVWLAKAGLYFVAFSIAWVLLYRFVNPPVTWLMIQRNLEGSEGPKPRADRKWVNYEELSDNLKKAVVASEDAHFASHGGFDTEAINEAYRKNKSGNTLRGGSTISQQTAKNVFLWPQRSWVRKGFEAWFTMLIEVFWGKKRILEVYLNVIETGPFLYGANAATQHYFNKPAVSLTKRQAALIAAVLPNPRRWTPDKPTAYINRKARTIVRYMNHSIIPE